MERRYSFENLQKDIYGCTPKESIEIIKRRLEFYHEWKFKDDQDYTARLFEYDFYDKATVLLNEFENLSPVAYNRELNWYFNTDNIPNDELVLSTEHFLNSERKGLFETTNFFNILYRQIDGLKDSLDIPVDYLDSLKSLPFSDDQKYLLFGMILYWHGGYPINNINPRYNIILKLIEREFLSMFPGTETPEREFCKASSNKRNYLMKLGIAFTTAVNNNIDVRDILDAMPEKETKEKTYRSFDELFNDAANAKALGDFKNTQARLIQQSKLNYEFNVWLQETQGWEYGNEVQYREFLTKRVFKDFLAFQERQKQQQITDFEAEKASWGIDITEQTKNEETESSQEVIMMDNKVEQNNYLKSTIEDYLVDVKTAFNNDTDYSRAVEILEAYFKTESTEISQSIFIKQGSKKKLAFALGEIYRSQKNEALCFEYLNLSRNLFTIFKQEDLPNDQINKSNLYKYFTSKP